MLILKGMKVVAFVSFFCFLSYELFNAGVKVKSIDQITTIAKLTRINGDSCSIVTLSSYKNKFKDNINNTNDVLHRVFPATYKSGLYIYRAYYDARVLIPKIRISGILHKDNLDMINKFYCYIWIQNKAIVIQAAGFFIWKSQGFYQAVLLTCDIPFSYSKIVPDFVSASYDNCSEPLNLVPVRKQYQVNSQRKTDGPKLDFAVCLKVLYGKPDPVRLIEWIELNLLLGANKIYFYVTSLNKEVMDILNHYNNFGKIFLQNHLFPELVAKQLLNTKFPTHDYYQNWELELLSMTDCIYQSKEKYLLNIDIDEIIYANNFSTVTEYLIHRERHFTPAASILFHTGVYSDEFEIKNSSQPNYLHTLRHNIRTKLDWESPKSINRRDSCIAPGHHLCLHPIEGIPLRVDENEAVGHVRHYRHKCRLTGEPDKCKKLLANPYIDDSLLFLKGYLEKTVFEKMQHFGLNM